MTAHPTPTPVTPDMFLDPDWAKAEKREDPSFSGSIYEKVGLSNLICPTCGSHLSQDGSICLNGCHLIKSSRDKLRLSNIEDILKAYSDTMKDEESQ